MGSTHAHSHFNGYIDALGYACAFLHASAHNRYVGLHAHKHMYADTQHCTIPTNKCWHTHACKHFCAHIHARLCTHTYATRICREEQVEELGKGTGQGPEEVSLAGVAEVPRSTDLGHVLCKVAIEELHLFALPLDRSRVLLQQTW